MREYHATSVLLACLLATAAGCSGASTQSADGQGLQLNATVPPPPTGTTAPGGNLGNAQPPFLGDPNSGGQAPDLFIADLSFGRLVDVFDFDSSTGVRRLVFEDVVIGASVVSDGIDYLLDFNLAQRDELTILHENGTTAFSAALAAAEALREPVLDAGLPPLLGPWSTIQRNAAISLRLNDLLDADTISPSTIQLAVGYPPEVPYEARVFADRNHGALADPDGDGLQRFYPTRVILDLAVSELDGASSNPPVAVNGLGLPPSLNTSEPNVALRIPTKTAPQVGQTQILTNLAGNGLEFNGNGANDGSVPTLDILRGLRSGGETALTGDPQNGFLPDTRNPRIVGELLMAFSGTILPDPLVRRGFVIPTATFNTPSCSSFVEEGDLIQQGGLYAVVYDTGAQGGGVVQDLKLRVLFSNTGRPTVGLATITTFYDPLSDDADCFISYVPTAATPPSDGVSPQATASVRFSEPMDVDSVSSFYGFTIADAPTSPAQSDELIAGLAFSDAGLLEFTFQPSSPFPHVQGNSETYHVHVGDDPLQPVLDVAGLPLAVPINDAQFRLDAGAVTNSSGSLVLRFEDSDMLGSDGFDEFRGQYTLDAGEQRMDPRPVSRFQGSADRNNPLPGAMTPLGFGVQAPLVPLGSKLHKLWRYADLGFDLTDDATLNLDVESLSWAPLGGQVVADAYPEFSITLGHADQVPDEVLNPQTFLPQYPSSGLGAVFADNFLEPGQVVHPKQEGYVVNPADLYVSASGTPMMPYPLNQAGAVEDYAFYTWRDTALQSVGGQGGAGVPLDQEILINGLGPEKDYAAGAVPTIGLPLLMELRCYPTNQAIGVNAFDISIAANSSPRPNFRAFSAGGFDTSGSPVLVDPDTEAVASGGFNPGSNPPGASTPPLDNSFYIGAVDFVTTKSRVHSVWFDTRTVAPNFTQVVTLADVPPGTTVDVAFRGADALVGGAPGQPFYIGADAAGLDAYGDPLPEPSAGAPSFFAGVSSWTNDISLLNGARYVQVRISFLGNPVSSEVANLGGLALSWTD